MSVMEPGTCAVSGFTRLIARHLVVGNTVERHVQPQDTQI